MRDCGLTGWGITSGVLGFGPPLPGPGTGPGGPVEGGTPVVVGVGGPLRLPALEVRQ